MTAKHIIPLIALSVAAAYAGDRETFDFGWKFKYFGQPVGASSSQSGHPAAHAIDGNPETRWCARNGKPGHWISVCPGTKTAVSKLVILWENERPKTAHVEIASGEDTLKKTVKVTSGRTELSLGDRPVRSLRITVDGTAPDHWASIREISLLDSKGRPLAIRDESDESPAQPGYREKGFRGVQLPHDWAISSNFLKDEPNETGKLPWNGYGWYRKSFDVPMGFDATKDRYYLDFDGVMSCPKVYVNGKLAGEWAYGYSSFRVDMTPYLKAGQRNLIAVVASNKPLSTRWYPGAGIYRHVWLEKTGTTHLARWGVYVTTPEVSKEKAVVRIQTAVDNTGDKPVSVQVKQSIGDVRAEPVTVVVQPGASEVVEQQVTLPDPALWSCGNPHLYTVKTTLLKDGKAVDDASTDFGVRTAEWRADGFYLNGERVYLKGVCEHHDLGPLGAAFYERGYERKIEKLKEMGCNSIRMTHNPPAPEVLDLCDKHGILVIDELFDIWKHQKYDKVNGYHVFWPQWWQKDVRNFVMRDRNHPSIIAWSGGNEVPELDTADGPQVSSALREEFKKYDATRPYTVGVNSRRALFNGFCDTLDVTGMNYKPFDYKPYEEKYPGKPFYGSETVSCVATRDFYVFPMGWGIGQGAQSFQVSSYGLYAPGWAYSPDAEFTAQDACPNVGGEYVWTGWDYIGEPTPYNQDASNVGNLKGLSEAEKNAIMKRMEEMGNKAPSRSSYFGIIDLAGFPKNTFYLYQSRWNPTVRQAHIFPHWNWKGREGQKTPVMVFSAGDEAELFLNGKSQGVRKRGMEGGTFNQARQTIGKNAYRFTWEDVVYEPGELKVVVKKDGKEWATAVRATTGKAARMGVEADRKTIVGDARDLAYLEVSVQDAKGNVVPTDCRKVTFSVEGPASLVGFCNGDPTDHTSMQSPRQVFFNGRIVAVLRGNRGESGVATVSIRADGLPEVKIPVKIAPATAEQLRK